MGRLFGKKEKSKNNGRIVYQREVRMDSGETIYTGRVKFKDPLPEARPTPRQQSKLR